MASQPKIDLDELNRTLQSILPNAKGNPQLPPVDSWDPPYCGDIGLEIRADGSWWHQGTQFTRDKLVKLFASILRKDEDGRTYVVTPHEKVLVHVDDAPFLGIRVDEVSEDDQKFVAITTNLGDTVLISKKTPFRVDTNGATGEPKPYVLVRGRLEAKLTRAAFIDLVELTYEEDGEAVFRSGDARFSLGKVDGL